MVDRLIGSQAWTEAALALVEHELPLWKLRRLVFEEGVWLCTLSKQRNLPIWLSDDAEASHESLPLAILAAFIEARRHPSRHRTCGELGSAMPDRIRLSRREHVLRQLCLSRLALPAW